MSLADQAINRIERLRAAKISALAKLQRENGLLLARLEQIAIVCTDNMDRDKDHRMALDFVRQIANASNEN